MSLQLPFVALIDTSVLLCRLGDKPSDVDSPACIDFCDRMMQAGRTICVAARWETEPSITSSTMR